MYVKKAVALEVLTAIIVELQSQSINCRMRKRLDAILLTTNDARHRIDRLRR